MLELPTWTFTTAFAVIPTPSYLNHLDGMLITISEFSDRVLHGGLDRLLDDLAAETGRYGQAERTAVAASFEQLALTLGNSSLKPIHLYLGSVGNLSVEYRLPASSSWCDMVLLGHNGERPSAVILELKHWHTRTDKSLPYPGLIEHGQALTLHPAEQVRGYVEYCRWFHSAFSDNRAVVNGCVVFTSEPLNPAYLADANRELIESHPCFSVATPEDTSAAIAYLNRKITKPDSEFAQGFESGHYRQSRNFISVIGETLRRSPHHRLALLDEQRKGLYLALGAVREALLNQSNARPKKKVIIIEGPPGSGKSAIAAQLWAELAADPTIPHGNLGYVTTSDSQNHNVAKLFGAGQGAVKKASQFSPISIPDANKLAARFPQQFSDASNWRKNVEVLRAITSFRISDNAFLATIVDEAHALVNPEKSDARGPVGFPIVFGPLGYHIIRGSLVSVFLMDQAQGFRDKETTTRADLEQWAKELGVSHDDVQLVSLEDRQFRCGGSVEYIRWLDLLMAGAPPEDLAALSKHWRYARPFAVSEPYAAEDSNVVAFSGPRAQFTFEIVDSPAELDAMLAARRDEGDSVRIVASYARPWRTEDAIRPHNLPPQMQDFVLNWTNASGEHTWNRIWNWKNAPEGYVSWVDPSPGVPMAADPLCEVGCPYTVRGFDYDWLGVLWLDDIVWRDGRWACVLENVHESGLSRHRQRARHEANGAGPHTDALIRRLGNVFKPA